MKKEIALSLAVAALTSAPSAASGQQKNQEKCYGVAKKGHNDCGTKTHGCHGHSKFDNQKDEWIYVPKGLCKKLASGSLKPQPDPRVKK